MPIIQTPKELGLAIRSRRKALGWDQATLAKQVGVTRQWVIDIEKGKPRAELALAMRAVRVLGLSLNVESKPEGNVAPDNERGGHPTPGTPSLDINAIVERNRGAAASHSAALPNTMADYLKQLEAARRLDSLASINVARSAADLLGGNALTSRLSELANPRLPNTAADYLKQLEAARRLDSLASINVARSAADLLGGNALTNRLSELANPRLPNTAADYQKEMAARRLDSLASIDAVRRAFDPLREAASASRLADPAFPKLPRTIADELRAIEATRRFDHPANAVRPDDDRSESPAGSTRSAGTRRKAGESAKGKPASKRPGRER
jgi:y4mF family transcriptional regulator